MRYLLLLLLVLQAPAAAAQSATDLAATRQLLTAELGLARGSKIYFIINLPQASVQFRASGVSLVELPVRQQRLWGAPPARPLTRLLAKDALFQPQREVVRLTATGKGAEITNPAEPAALELADMPVRYRLSLADGTVLQVIPQPTSVIGSSLEYLRGCAWLVSRPMISVWNFIRRRPYTEVRLALDADDARLLYWSLTVEADCLINWRSG